MTNGRNRLAGAMLRHNQGKVDKVDNTTDKGMRKCNIQQLDRIIFFRRNLSSEELFTEVRDVGREEYKSGPRQHMENFLKVVKILKIVRMDV